MEEYITNELIENTYLFCVKRISDSEAARDLSQEILLEAIQCIKSGKTFIHFHSWYWKMARNKYVNFLAAKQNHALPIDEVMGIADDSLTPMEQLMDEENIAMLNYSLSRLASIYREIVIRFYLKEQPITQIATELHVPVGTVKRRLFDAKKHLKERFEHMNYIGKTAYAPAEVDWQWGFGAQLPSQLMASTSICPQTMVICRNEAKALNEIADEIGVAPIYLEEILCQMVELNLLTMPSKGTYQANHCVFPMKEYQKAYRYMLDVLCDNGFSKRIHEILSGLKEQVESLDFYGNHFDYRYLLWLLYPIASANISALARTHYMKKYKGRYQDEAERTYRLTVKYTPADETYTKEPLKAKPYSCLHQTFSSASFGKAWFVNLYEQEPFPNECYHDRDWRRGRDRWVDGSNIFLLVELSKNPDKILSACEEEKAAELLAHGLIAKESDKLIVQMPIFSKTVYKEICALIKNAVSDISIEYAETIAPTVEGILLPFVRKDLMSNFIYWDMRQFFEPVSGLFYYGWDNELAMPDDFSRSAAGLYVMTE